MFSHLRTALLKTFVVSSSKKIVKLLDTGGLHILKQVHLFFEMLNSEQIHSILSQVLRYCFTNKTIFYKFDQTPDRQTDI